MYKYIFLIIPSIPITIIIKLVSDIISNLEIIKKMHENSRRL